MNIGGAEQGYSCQHWVRRICGVGNSQLAVWKTCKNGQRFTQEPAVAAAETIVGVYKLQESVAPICSLNPIRSGIITDACGEREYLVM